MKIHHILDDRLLQLQNALENGACCRLAFCTPDWDFSSVDRLAAYGFAEPAYRAFGFRAKEKREAQAEALLEMRELESEAIEAAALICAGL